jgi:hypothetical protein
VSGVGNHYDSERMNGLLTIVHSKGSYLNNKHSNLDIFCQLDLENSRLAHA